MCVDFTDLNIACSKDTYPLSDIDRLIDRSSSYRVLSFMDVYSGYNHDNYYNNVLAFNIKNIGATYQCFMDAVFTYQIWRNLEVYVDDMIIKTTNGHNHANDLEDILQLIRWYDMRLNPAKCSFRV